ncbi:hypothetical protein [Methylocapsa palsarum]|uniref:Aspartyl protease n=1 Tax=Methylocapsa palsarum TaxID=1612308 RepID=A0A1I4BQB8_9HYPH|nr:hypothetical protein [Methylocapsa palsarum]SFK71032.1 hypothetical protein SAMN05444581_11621 [Methylocapsa palsarum]
MFARLKSAGLAISAAVFLAASARAIHADESLCGGRRYELRAKPNGASPYIELGAQGASGLFLLDYGSTKSSIARGAPIKPQELTASLLPHGPRAGLFERGAYDLPVAEAEGRFGILGTDLLSQLNIELTSAAAFLSPPPCSPEALRGQGLVPVAQIGFFSAAPSSGKFPNVPVVFLRIGEVRTWAQIDTGYDDVAYTHSIDINEAFFDRLSASGLLLSPLPDVQVSTCEGLERRSVYTIKDLPLAIENREGAPIAQTQMYHLILKRANGCGGIGAVAIPAAQLGASFLRVFGPVVFDPASETVWLTKQAEGRP